MDSSLFKANVSGYDLAPSEMTIEEFEEQDIEVNGLFIIAETTVDDDGVEHGEMRYFQRPEGRMPLNPADTDARWRTSRTGKAPGLQYQEDVIVDRGEFILSRGVTHASEGSRKRFRMSLAGDIGCGEGQFRQLLEERNITAHIPIHPRQEPSMVSTGDFAYLGDHLICPQGKVQRRGTFHRRSRTYQYVVHQKDCQACPVKDTCLPARQKRRYFSLTMYHPVYLSDRERNRTAA